jgi:pyrroline-5-carboxylate reductase
MRIAFIGGGMMGEAMIAGVLSKQVVSPADIAVAEIVPERREYLAARHGVQVFAGALQAAADADVIVLAVKPQEFSLAGKELAGRLTASQTVMSIMAGVSIDSIHSILQHAAVVRCIPNTPAQIGEGMTVWSATDAVPDSGREAVRRVLAVLGKEIYVTDEKYIDMATAVSSSGPAYVFLVIEALIDAAVHVGLRRDMAAPMVIQTVLGSARYAESTGKHPSELRNQVTSPGGTTTAGLQALENAGIRAAFTAAVEAAHRRAKELGG